MVPADVVYWAGLGAAGLLSFGLGANEVASSVAMAIGADVGRWTLVMGVAAGGYVVGGVLSGRPIANIFDEYLRQDKTNKSSTIGNAKDIDDNGKAGSSNAIDAEAERRISLILLVMGWTALATGAASVLKMPIAGTITMALALWTGALIESLPYTGDLPWKMLWTHALVIGLSTVLALCAHTLISRWLFNCADPLTACLAAMPVLYGAVLPFYASLLICSHFKSYWNDYNSSPILTDGHLAVVGVVLWVIFAVIVWLACRFVLVPRTKRRVFDLYPQQVLDYSGGSNNEEQHLAERGMVVRRVSPVPSADAKRPIEDSASQSLPTTTLPLASATLARIRAEEALKYFLLTLAGLGAATQGVFDIGLIYGLLRVFSSDCHPSLSYLTVKPLLLAIICVSGVAGILLFGLRPASTLGRELVQMTPSSAVAIELGCFLPILFCAILGCPISPLLIKLPAIIMVTRHTSQPKIKTRVLSFMLLIISCAMLAVPLMVSALMFLSQSTHLV